MNAVDRSKAGVASGTLSMFRMVGGTFGVAALGALVASVGRHDLEQSLPQVPAATRDALADGLGSGAGAAGRAAAGRERGAGGVRRRARHRPDDQRGRGRGRRVARVAADRAGPPAAGRRRSRSRRGRGRGRAGPGLAGRPVHPLEWQTPPPHGGVSSLPPIRRNWSFMSRASCVRRGNSCGSWPSDGGMFAVGGRGVPCGLAGESGPESNTISAEPEYGKPSGPGSRGTGRRRPAARIELVPARARRSCAPRPPP